MCGIKQHRDHKQPFYSRVNNGQILNPDTGLFWVNFIKPKTVFLCTYNVETKCYNKYNSTYSQNKQFIQTQNILIFEPTAAEVKRKNGAERKKKYGAEVKIFAKKNGAEVKRFPIFFQHPVTLMNCPLMLTSTTIPMNQIYLLFYLLL